MRSVLIATALVLGTVAFVAIGCSETGADCTSREDCAGDQVCFAGSCTAAPSQCDDDDGDGFSSGPGCPLTEAIDCDDSDAAINPGLTEICGDGIDQNCSGGADEGCACVDVGLGTTRSCGEGACAGVQTCGETGWSVCTPAVNPRPEDCGPDGTGNGVDEDCNGVADEGCFEDVPDASFPTDAPMSGV